MNILLRGPDRYCFFGLFPSKWLDLGKTTANPKNSLHPFRPIKSRGTTFQIVTPSFGITTAAAEFPRAARAGLPLRRSGLGWPARGALECFHQCCSGAGMALKREGLFGSGLRFGSLTGRCEPARSPKPRPEPKILLPHRYIISVNALERRTSCRLNASEPLQSLLHGKLRLA